MNTIFILLLLVSICCLIVGLAKPELVSKVIKKNMSRKYIGLVFGAVTFALMIMSGATAPAKQQEIKQENGLIAETQKTQTKPATEKIETRTEAVYFPTSNENDPTLPKGQTKIKQAGEKGSKEVTAKVTYIDGKETKRETITEVVTLAPVPSIVLVGTYVEPAPPVQAPPNKWYEGGSLHKATILEWRNATAENRLATSADMAVASKKVVADVDGDIEKLKPYALQMLACVDEASSGQGYENMKVADLAVSCIFMMWGE